MKSALPLLAVLMLAACEPANTDASASGEDTTSASEAADNSSAPAMTAIALDGEGLRLVNPETGSTNLVAFGTPYDETLMAVHLALGDPTGSGVSEECPPGPLDVSEFGEDTTLYFQDGAFAGWFTRDADQSTMNGIHPGSTRAELDGSGSEVELTETSLGQEFDAGGVYGVMNEDASAVDLLWAGANCFAR